MFQTVKEFDPDIFLGFGSIRAAHVAALLRSPYIALDDTEHARFEHMLYVPFTDAVLLPTSFKKDFGDRIISGMMAIPNCSISIPIFLS
jgi:uncharacterized protein